MKIVKTMIEPSREDAVRLTRNEKMSMIVLAYAATILEDLKEELKDRIQMVPDGAKLLEQLSAGTDDLLHKLRLTIPMNQRMNLQNTAHDFEIRLAPKASPSNTTVVATKEEFRTLVDASRAKCDRCADDDTECERCELYQLLTVLLPLDDYHTGYMCPYNRGEWKN